MKRLSNSSKTFWLITFPSGTALAIIAQLVATSCGLGLTFDSHLYLEGADFFQGVAKEQMTELLVFQAKPPLFSFLLALIPGPITAYFFTLLLFINLYLIGRLVREIVASYFWQTIAFLAIACFTPLIMVHVYLWSEPVFLIFLYATVLILLQSIKTGLSQHSLIWLIILTVGLVLTRHVALFFILGILLVMRTTESIGWKKGLYVLLPAFLVFALWNFGFMTEGIAGRLTTLKAPVAGSSWARFQNIGYYFATASTWVLPQSLPKLLRMVVMAALGVTTIYFLRNELRQSVAAKTLLILALTYYLLMHVSFLIPPSSADRYLMPIYPLVIIAIFKLIELSVFASNRWLKYLLILWLLYPIGRLGKNAIFWQEKICHEAELASSIDHLENYQVKQD